MDNEIKNNKYLIPIIIIGALVITVSVSYAIWQMTHIATKSNVVKTGCFSTEFSEGSNSINLNNTIPISDEAGKLQTPYEFTIKNTCSVTANFEVALDTLSTTTLANNQIKIDINDDTKTLTDFSSGTSTIEGALGSFVLYTSSLAPEATKTFNLRLWLDENASAETSQNKTYEGKIVIHSTATQ